MSHKLDAMVAERVMGVNPIITLEVSNDGGKSSAFGNGDWSTRFVDVHAWLAEKQSRGLMKDYCVVDWKHYPRYSTDIAAAWEVVDSVLKLRDDVRFSIYFGCLCKPTARFFVVASGADLALCFADTAPLAICLAALRAVGVTKAEIEEAMR